MRLTSSLNLSKWAWKKSKPQKLFRPLRGRNSFWGFKFNRAYLLRRILRWDDSQQDLGAEERTVDNICDRVLSTGTPLVLGEGDRRISIIPTSELASLLETVYLYQTHANAKRLLDALDRAQTGVNQPKTIQELRREFGLGDEEEKILA